MNARVGGHGQRDADLALQSRLLAFYSASEEVQERAHARFYLARYSLVGLGDILEECGEMLLLVLKEVKLPSAFLLLLFFALGVASLDRLKLRSQLNYFVRLFCLFGLELGDSLLQIGLSVLGLQLLAHSECYGALNSRKVSFCGLNLNLPLVKGLIRGNSHLDLVANSEQEQTSFGLTQSDLTNDLIEALREKLFTHWANATFSRLTLHQFLVQHLTKLSDIDS